MPYSLKAINGLLIPERENEILTDLANVGLAAEVVDHEFNQYFANVTNAISRLKVLSLQPTAKYLLEQIDTGFRAISNRHSQLSPMYRSYNYKRKDHRVIDVVHAVTNFYSTSIVKNSIKVQFDIDEDDTIFISTSKIYPALSNLLNNAIYWAKSKGEKLILWRFDCKKHSLYIEDTGPGIPERLKDKSFELFFSLKPSGTGRGMGLYLTKKILESEGHAIDIVYDINEKRLNGACFRITFREGNK
jgi:signal transduction histidine kinase